jgi:anti-sigma factor RsiW
MNCAEVRPWLDPYVDDELDLTRSLEVEQHLAECKTCTSKIDALRQLRGAIVAHAPYHAAPAELRKRIGRLAPRPASRIGWMAAAAACAAAGLALVAFLATTRGNPVEQAVVDSHIRSMLANHLTDVASSDRHTVKPWFNGKLDFGVDVFDFASAGFLLVGGRLDYLDGRTVAALVYTRGKHVINVFVWPGETRAGADTRKGYNVIRWNAGGMSWWAVSDVNPQDLRELAQLLSQAEAQAR